MNNNERLDLARWVVTQGKKSGADDLAVGIGSSRQIDIEYREKTLDVLKESTSNYLSLDIYAANRYSSHSTNDLKKESLTKFIEEAVAMTKYLSEDKYRILPNPKYYEGRQNIDLQLRDGKYETVTSDARVNTARQLEETVMAQSQNIISCTAYSGDSLDESVKVHSNGFEGTSESTSFYAGATVTVRDGDAGRPEDYSFATVCSYKDLPAVDVIGKDATRRALDKIGQTKMESGKYDLILENRVASRLLGYLYGAMTGEAIQQKSTFLDGMLEKKIASDILTIYDDPFIKGGLGSKLYDGDGFTAKKRVIIEKGVLKTFFIDNYYALKLGVEPTTGGTSNTVFEYGTKSLEQMIKEVKKGIMVTSFIGGNSNGTTGDFSVGIIGFYIENGAIVKPVNEMNIASNHKEFWNQLVEVGNDPYIYSSNRRPSLYFKDVFFSGI